VLDRDRRLRLVTTGPVPSGRYALRLVRGSLERRLAVTIVH
jgi:hypothetical protein